MAKREYIKDDMVIKWDSDLCVHCGICHTELPEVFQPDSRPWVNVNGADKLTILQQIERCPSGALNHAKKTDNN